MWATWTPSPSWWTGRSGSSAPLVSLVALVPTSTHSSMTKLLAAPTAPVEEPRSRAQGSRGVPTLRWSGAPARATVA